MHFILNTNSDFVVFGDLCKMGTAGPLGPMASAPADTWGELWQAAEGEEDAIAPGETETAHTERNRTRRLPTGNSFALVVAGEPTPGDIALLWSLLELVVDPDPESALTADAREMNSKEPLSADGWRLVFYAARHGQMGSVLAGPGFSHPVLTYAAGLLGSQVPARAA